MTTVNLERLKKPFTFTRGEFGDVDVADDLALRRIYEPLKAKSGLAARVPVTFKSAVVKRLHDEAQDLRLKDPQIPYTDAVKRIGARRPWLLYFATLENYEDNDRSLDVEIEYEDKPESGE